ncbi:hypothetical protein K7X08_028268 [Anisodus acutangulus]|uniref:Uncharacterized protein n=1 Tax=Anisodus acutangulus TaxID=402998 RepID=A0A9Q1M659_9SOLA|nr:hypothetical protein K7X08_028268 [Anisodus acutangulus]
MFFEVLRNEDAFAYYDGLHTNCADLDVDDNQGVRGDDDNVNDVSPNDGVGGGDSSNEAIDEGNASQSDSVFVLVSEYAIVAITQKYHTDKKVKKTL